MSNEPFMVDMAIGSRPVVTMKINGIQVRCLADTGAQVSTETESFYDQHFSESLQDVSPYLKIMAGSVCGKL